MKKIQRITPSSIRIVRRYSDNIAPTTVPFAAAPKFSFGGGNRQFSFGGGNRQFSFGGGNRQFSFGGGNRQFSFGGGNRQFAI